MDKEIKMRKKLNNEMKYAIDIPSLDNDEWICVEYFETKQKAIKFSRSKFGADKDGKISLVHSL